MKQGSELRAKPDSQTCLNNSLDLQNLNTSKRITRTNPYMKSIMDQESSAIYNGPTTTLDHYRFSMDKNSFQNRKYHLYIIGKMQISGREENRDSANRKHHSERRNIFPLGLTRRWTVINFD